MTTTTDTPPCGTITRAGQPCRNPTTASGTCTVHDPARWCGADTARGTPCRRPAPHPGQRCELHDPAVVEHRRNLEARNCEDAPRWQAAAEAAAAARTLEADAILAALVGCTDCTAATLRAVLLTDPPDPYADDDEDGDTPVSVAWAHVVDHLRHGHGLTGASR